MQNIDFYSGKMTRDTAPGLNSENPEYFAKLANAHSKEEEKNIKKATRMLFLIISLCIISFTIGLVIGIKFVNGSKREIVDERTKEAVDNIGKKVATFVKDSAIPDLNAAPVGKKDLFSRTQFPYAIKIPKEFSKSESQEIASHLSSKRQTVILSNNKGKYRVYIGPFSTMKEAEASLKKIRKSSNVRYLSNAFIIKR